MSKQRWKDKRDDLTGSANSLVRVLGLPQLPSAEFSRGGDVRLSVYYRDKWLSIDAVSVDVEERVATFDRLRFDQCR